VLATEVREEAMAFVAAQAAPGDTVLVLGAGDVGALAPRLVERFRGGAAPSAEGG
jgi:UDP-N-acetylmuramate-alanine ligase